MKAAAAVADRGDAPQAAAGSSARPGILLDRDGTIIVDHGYVGSVDRVEFIDGAAEAIAAFNRAGIPVAVVTNQAGVARGLYGLDDVAAVHRHIAARLAELGARVDLFLYCPYHPDGIVEGFARTSEDRKPRPGMAKAAATALNLDLTASWVVGDRPEDLGLAEVVGRIRRLPGPRRPRPPRGLVIPQPGRGGAVSPAAIAYEFGYDARTSGAARCKFPVAPYASAGSYFDAYAEEMARAAKTVEPTAFDAAAAILIGAYQRGSRMFSCGNGGSASIANHMQCDHVKGVRTETDLAPQVLSLSTNVELLYRDRQRHRLRARLRLPAAVPGPPG